MGMKYVCSLLGYRCSCTDESVGMCGCMRACILNVCECVRMKECVNM